MNSIPCTFRISNFISCLKKGLSVKWRTFTYLYIMTQKSVDWCRTVGVRHCRAENSVECPGSMIYSVVISRCRKLWTSPTSWWMDEYPGAVHSLVYQQNYIVLRALLQKWPMGKMKHSAVNAMNNSLCCYSLLLDRELNLAKFTVATTLCRCWQLTATVNNPKYFAHCLKVFH